jgi:DUF438 domain-containing protein
MLGKNPIHRLDQHHTQVLKNTARLNHLINEIETGGLEVMQLHHHDLVKLRHQILNDSIVHFRQEEEVLFPEILKQIPEARGLINELLEEHNLIRTLYHDLLQAITEEKPQSFVETAQSAGEILQNHIIKEDAFLNESGSKCLHSEDFESMNHQLNLIEQDCANWPSNQL